MCSRQPLLSEPALRILAQPGSRPRALRRQWIHKAAVRAWQEPYCLLGPERARMRATVTKHGADKHCAMLAKLRVGTKQLRKL